jgi:hypothetical protein
MEEQELYNYIYSHGSLNRGPYGSNYNRIGEFGKFIKENVRVGSTVFDASCGRGHLIKWLNIAGYEASGSEYADVLMQPGFDLYGQPVIACSYMDLDKIGKQYDVVISCDVLEHLPSINYLNEVFPKLVGLSKKWVLVSVGLGGSVNPCSVETRCKDLHIIKKPSSWWKEFYKKYCNLERYIDLSRTCFMFGTIK